MANLLGYRFNMFEVVAKSDKKKNGKSLWVCECGCSSHTRRILSTDEVNSGIIYSCGCTDYDSNVKHNLVGQRFNKLVVIAEVGESRWLCECLCRAKNRLVVEEVDLFSGAVKNCGKCITAHKDLTGQVFGHVTAVEYLYTNADNRAVWDCVCECGRHDIFDSHSLSDKRLANRTCKYCRSEKMSKLKQANLIGQKFGDLIVTDFAYVKNEKTYWKCFCTRCNNDGFIVQGKRLKNGNTKSCGCRRHRSGEDNPKFKSITGNVYDHLTAIRYDHTDKYGHPHWVFFCDICKKEKVINKPDVLAGKIHSCGCNNTAVSGSIAENEIKEYIASLIDDIPEKTSDILFGKEIDIYYKKYNIGIEYNGSVYHASKGSLYEDKEKTYHQDKFLTAKMQGVHLLSIFDVDWKYNQDKIKSYLRSLFIPQTKIMARKCVIKRVDSIITNEFMDKYHLQGKTQYNHINYGLYYNDELMAIMSFDWVAYKSHVDGRYELHRYCVKDGYTIVGGANKLLKAFERDYHPNYLVSYSDNDYFLGGIYESLGFRCVSQTSPRYYWYLNGEAIGREKTKLKKLKKDKKIAPLVDEAIAVNAPNKEDYVMLKLKACKVYRSGRTKWEKHYENNIS